MPSRVEVLRVRLAKAEDAETIADLNVRLAEESESLNLDRTKVRRGVEAVFRHPDRGFYLLAEFSGGIVGQLLLTKEWSDWRSAFFWWLQSVYVLPDFRRRGVFRTLLEHARRMAEGNRDVCGLRLYVHEDNEEAQRVYLRLGMKRLSYRMLGLDLGSDGRTDA